MDAHPQKKARLSSEGPNKAPMSQEAKEARRIARQQAIRKAFDQPDTPSSPQNRSAAESTQSTVASTSRTPVLPAAGKVESSVFASRSGSAADESKDAKRGFQRTPSGATAQSASS